MIVLCYWDQYSGDSANSGHMNTLSLGKKRRVSSFEVYWVTKGQKKSTCDELQIVLVVVDRAHRGIEERSIKVLYFNYRIRIVSRRWKGGFSWHIWVVKICI